MKVKDLIRQLMDINSDAEVFIPNDMSWKWFNVKRAKMIVPIIFKENSVTIEVDSSSHPTKKDCTGIILQ